MWDCPARKQAILHVLKICIHIAQPFDLCRGDVCIGGRVGPYVAFSVHGLCSLAVTMIHHLSLAAGRASPHRWCCAILLTCDE